MPSITRRDQGISGIPLVHGRAVQRTTTPVHRQGVIGGEATGEGPHDGLAAFVHARGPALVRFAHGLCGERALAEDLVQDALVKLVRRFGERLQVEHPEAYVRQVVVREFLQWRRRRRPVEVPGDVPDLPSPVVTGESGTDEREVVWAALTGLPPKQRAVLVLGFYEDLPDDEIAALIGCSRGTVRSQRARALAKLTASPALSQERAPGQRRLS